MFPRSTMLALAMSVLAALAPPSAAMSLAGGAEKTKADMAPKHYWAHVLGDPGMYSNSKFKGPENMTANFSWSWHHPEGRYATTMLGGALMDDKKNIYVSTEAGIYKLSQKGDVLWHHDARGPVSQVAVLHGDALYGTSLSGYVYALELDTGYERWAFKHGNDTGGDTAYVEAFNGVIVTGFEHNPAMGAGNLHIRGINSTDGALLWDYKPPQPIWNIMAMFPGDDTTVVMDLTGGVVRLGLFNGTQIWQSPAPGGTSFSDGGAVLGPNGDVFTCSNPVGMSGSEGTMGVLRRFRIGDGKILWSTLLPHPCNSWPAVTPNGDTVVVVPGSFNGNPQTMELLMQGVIQMVPPSMTSMPPIDYSSVTLLAAHERALALGDGERAHYGQPNLTAAIMAFNTTDGKKLWSHSVKPYGRVASMGDEAGFPERLSRQIRMSCLPAHWSSPKIDADGNVYVGRTNGYLYKYDPKNNTEETFFTGSGPLHSGPTFAPGVMAYTDCDTLYVFDI